MRLNSTVALELRRPPMSSDDECDVRMGDDGESEALSGSDEIEDDEDFDDPVFVDGDGEEEEEEDEEEEEEWQEQQHAQPAAPHKQQPAVPQKQQPAAAHAVPPTRIAELMRYVDRAREGDASYFQSHVADTFRQFPTLRVLFNARRLGEPCDLDGAAAPQKSQISGKRADRRVYPYGKTSRLSPIYLHSTEADTLRRFMALAGFMNTRWKAYATVDSRSLAEFYHNSTTEINRLEYDICA